MNTPLLSVGDRVLCWRNRAARVVRIVWGRIPCTAAPWWAAYHLWITLDNGRIVPAWKLRPVEVEPWE